MVKMYFIKVDDTTNLMFKKLRVFQKFFYMYYKKQFQCLIRLNTFQSFPQCFAMLLKTMFKPEL